MMFATHQQCGNLSEPMWWLHTDTGSDHNAEASSAMAIKYVPYAGPIVTRPQAQANGLKRYFDAKPCSRGHLSEKMVSNRTCVTCLQQSIAGWRAANTDRVSEYNSNYYYADHAASKARGLAAYYANREARLEANRAWHVEHSDIHKERCRSWRENNVERKRIHDNNRRARKLATNGTYTAADIERIYADQRGRCAYCRAKLGQRFWRDHIVPLAKGGTNTARNIQLTCRRCNARKYALMPEVFARRLGRLL